MRSPGAKFKGNTWGFGQLSCFIFLIRLLQRWWNDYYFNKLYNKILELRDHGMSRKKSMFSIEWGILQNDKYRLQLVRSTY